MAARLGTKCDLAFRICFVCMCSVTQLCPTLCNHTGCSPPGSSVHGILRQEYWTVLPFPSAGDLPEPGIEPESPALGVRFFTSEPPGKPMTMLASFVATC